MPTRPHRKRTPPPPKPEPRIVRCVVVGGARIHGRGQGEFVDLTEDHAERLIAGGHVALAPPKKKASASAVPKNEASKRNGPAIKAAPEREGES